MTARCQVNTPLVWTDDRCVELDALSCVGLQSRNDSGQHVTMRIVLEWYGKDEHGCHW